MQHIMRQNSHKDKCCSHKHGRRSVPLVCVGGVNVVSKSSSNQISCQSNLVSHRTKTCVCSVTNSLTGYCWNHNICPSFVQFLLLKHNEGDNLMASAMFASICTFCHLTCQVRGAQRTSGRFKLRTLLSLDEASSQRWTNQHVSMFCS